MESSKADCAIIPLFFILQWIMEKFHFWAWSCFPGLKECFGSLCLGNSSAIFLSKPHFTTDYDLTGNRIAHYSEQLDPCSSDVQNNYWRLGQLFNVLEIQMLLPILQAIADGIKSVSSENYTKNPLQILLYIGDKRQSLYGELQLLWF